MQHLFCVKQPENNENIWTLKNALLHVAPFYCTLIFDCFPADLDHLQSSEALPNIANQQDRISQ